MRRWHLLNRLRRRFSRQDTDRCILVVEELETREVLSPVVLAPSGSSLQTLEGAAYTFSGNSSFSVDESGEGGPNYQIDLIATNGTVSFTTLASGTTTFTGSLDEVNSLLSSGVTFQPTDYYSGNATVTLTVTDVANADATDAGTAALKVTPDASAPAFDVQAPAEVWAPSSGFVFPSGFVSISPWPDLDGSETVTVTFSLYGANADAFTLSAGGVPLTQPMPGLAQWQVSGTDPAALQATLDSLVLTPPAGFNDRVYLSIYAANRDQPLDGSSPPDDQFLGSGYVPLRFFVGGSVTTPAAFGVEGGSIDLGGRFVASDPDELVGDTHTLTLSVPSGTLTFNGSLVPEGASVGRDVAANGSTTITVTGTIDAINQFLAARGSMTYTPASAYFSGVVPLTITLTNQPGAPFSEGTYFASALAFTANDAPNPFTGVAALSFVPVADHAFPSALDVTTNQDTPVALSLGFSSLADTDGSESLLLLLAGVPAGATLNHGTDLGGGQWALSPADLAGLTFTPPPGATGTYTLTLKAVVTDSAPGLGLSDSATESTAFIVTVIPALVTVSPPLSPPAIPPVVPRLPPTETMVAPAGATFTSNTVADSGGVVTTTDTARPEPLLRTVTFDAYSSGANESQFGTTETQVGNMPPVPGSLFAQAEVPLPAYAYGEKHPLPPVLPLDQTIPVAGFSESGGDSFALIDKLYRDAAGDRFSASNPPEVVPPAVAATQAAVAVVTVVWTAPASTLTVAPEREDDPVAPEAGPVVADPPEGNWPVWLASSAVAGMLAAWVWLARGPRTPRVSQQSRLLRRLHRRPTQGTV